MIRVLHTADWHLGHTLHDVPRAYEHTRFLAWLLERIDEEHVDALVVAGDVFDTANPSAAAQRAWFGFLGEARRRRPRLDVVAIAGNHDSGARLDAPSPVLGAFGMHVVGALPRLPGGALDADRIVCPLHDRDGAVAAWVAAVPFLRPADLPRPAGVVAGESAGEGDGGDPAAAAAPDTLLDGVRAVYREALDLARARCGPAQALLATGHCYLTGTRLSELSERKVLGGNQHALPLDLFPDDVAYVALGHLHLAQAVGGREGVRYAGSPIPLALDEDGYPHQVCLVELDGPRLAAVRALPVPRTVSVLRVPSDGPGPIDAVVDQLAALPARDRAVPDEARPYLEVRVRLDRPRSVKRDVEAALDGREARLLKLSVTYPGAGRALADAERARGLAELTTEEVFRRRWLREHEGDPPGELLSAFHELVDAASQEPGG